MQIFKFKNKNLLGIYAIFLIWSVAVFILTRFTTTPLSLLVIFFWLILTPGFSLARLFNMAEKSIFEQKLMWIILGLIFGLSISLLGIFLHFDINLLLMVYLVGIGIVFAGAFTKDLFQPGSNIEFGWKNYLTTQNLILVFLGLFVLLIASVISQIGGNFDGDPVYHLSIMQKAINGQLSIDSLSFVKNQPMPAYAILIWPTFLGLLSKLVHVETYNLWGEIPAALTILVFVAWYGLFRKIFPNRLAAILGVLIFIIFMFESTGYLLTRLAVPDTLAKLVLMPLALWLALKYIFNATETVKTLIILSVFLPLLALVHLTQYFYFYLIMLAFTIVYSIFRFKDADYFQKLKKMFTATFSNLALTLPIFAFLQLNYNLITGSYTTLSGRQADSESQVDSFTKFDLFTKYAYVLLPSTLLFLKKYRIILIVLASMIIAPIVFHTPFLYKIVNSSLSFVFTKRLFSNVTWYFAVWTLVLTFIIILIDRALAKVKSSYRLFLSALVIIAAVALWYVRGTIYLTLFSSSVGKWQNANFWWMILAASFIALIIFIAQYRQEKIEKFFELSETKNHFVILVLIIAIVGLFSFSAEKTIVKNLSEQITKKTCLGPVRDFSPKAFTPERYGGEEALKFIKENIPPESIIESNIAYRDLPIVYDVHMAAWPNKRLPEKEYSKIYEPAESSELKLQCLAKSRAEFLLIGAKKLKSFGDFNGYLTKIYQNETVAIYKVEQEKIKTTGVNPAMDLDCRAKEFKR